jgi:hypothetical protein
MREAARSGKLLQLICLGLRHHQPIQSGYWHNVFNY